MKLLRIFISSPSDVAEERNKARLVVADLQRRYEAFVTLIPVLWEDFAIPATASFQEGIEIVLAERHRIDIAIFILWSRLGSPLGASIRKADGSSYVSGTEREFDMMLAVFERSGGKIPVILAYTRSDNEGFNNRLDATQQGDDALEELIRQRKLVKQFISERFLDKEGHNIRAYHSYREPVGFAQILHLHLRNAVDGLLKFDSAAITWAESPYRSLEVYDIRHTHIFCGRDEETCDLLQRLRDQEHSGCAFVCIVGASGSGKSSLARAGAAAALLLRSFDDNVKEWRAAIFLPSLGTGSILLALARILAESLPELHVGSGGIDHFTNLLENENHEASEILLETAFNVASAKIGGRLRILLMLDQMEELWTDRDITPEQREKFLKAVQTLACNGRFSVLATLRSDFYPQAQLSQTFLSMKGERGHFDLVAPGLAALRELIVQPAYRAGLRFERDERTNLTLDQRILEDAARDPSSLPLLQYALTELYERRDQKQRLLTFEAYEEMGGVEGSLGQRAAQTFGSLPPEAQTALDELLPLLVSVDVVGDQNAVRRRAPLADLTRTPARRLLTERLTEARFLTADEQKGAAIATLAHEALLRRWDRIATWIHANRDLLRMRAQLEQSHHRWSKSGRAHSLILPEGLPLEEGRRLLTEASHLLTGAIVDYVRISIAGYLSKAIESGRNLTNISNDVEENHPEVWRDVVVQALRSDIPCNRKNAAILQARRASSEFSQELVQMALQDTDDSVRQAAAHSLVLRDQRSAFDQIRDWISPGQRKILSPESRGALARLLAVSDMQPKRLMFATWFEEQPSEVTRSVRLLARWFRLKASLPTFLFVWIPAATFAVVGAASVKWLPSFFNYSCVQATGSAIMGLFHSAPAGIILGGTIVFGLTLYRMVFGREYDSVSILRPLPAIAFGAVSGLIAGILVVIMIAFVYHPTALEQMGWTNLTTRSVRPLAPQLFGDLFFGNRCGLAFPLTSVGLGVALALMTNGLRASKAWPEFVSQQSAISSVGQLARVILGTIRVTLRFAIPIPIFVLLGAALALTVMNRGSNTSFLEPAPLSEKLLGGMDKAPPEGISLEQKEIFLNRQGEKIIQWKTSLEGRALGLFGDCLAKMVGGYFAIVGMGVGIVVLRHGVMIDPKKV